MTKRAEMAEIIQKRATQMANTGKFAHWMDIEIQLRIDGYDDARSALHVHWFRDQLDKGCANAQAKKNQGND